MTAMTVTRWTRYGKDRLYVATPHGQRVGWLDLVSGEVTIEQPEWTDAFDEALSEHPVAQPVLHPTVAASHVESPTVLAAPLAAPVELLEPPTAEWEDLALRMPGQAVREQAQVELVAMKERSRFGTFVARVTDAKTDERAYRIGADGEASIGSRLDKLTSSGWHILHSVPVGVKDSDIDHVVIGPGGVYTINTKNHPGARVWVGQYAIKVNNFTTDYLHKSRFEARRAEKLLTAAVGFPVTVKPLLVFLTGTRVPNVTIKQQPDGVTVLDRTDIPASFKQAPQRLTTEHIEAIYAQARRSTTWI